MHEDIAAALRFLVGAGLVLFVSWLGWVLVQSARHGKKGVRNFGAMLMLFGWGNLRDPRNDTVAEANEGHVRKGENAGEPPHPVKPR